MRFIFDVKYSDFRLIKDIFIIFLKFYLNKKDYST